MEKEFQEIKNFLDKHNAEYKVFEHEPVYTSEQAAAVRGEDLKTGVKSLVFKAGRNFVLVLVPGDKKADMKKLRAVTGARDMRLATPHEVLDVTGCEIGSVHPFGNLMPTPLKIYMEESILGNKRVNFNVGLHTVTIQMNPHDLKELIKPAVVDLVKG